MDKFTFNNISTSRSSKEFYKLVCSKTDFVNNSTNTSRNFWTVSQLPDYIDQFLEYFSYWLFFLIDLSIYYFDLLFCEPSRYLSKSYFQFLFSKFEFKIFLLLIFLISILIFKITIAWHFFKDKIEYYNSHQGKKIVQSKLSEKYYFFCLQDSFKRPPNLNFKRNKITKLKL